jgi:hypothetical protein
MAAGRDLPRVALNYADERGQQSPNFSKDVGEVAVLPESKAAVR